MTPLLGPILAAVFLGQAPARLAFTGTVVDAKGRPVSGAEIFLQAGMSTESFEKFPTERVQTDEQGRFQIPANGTRLRTAFAGGAGRRNRPCSSV